MFPVPTSPPEEPRILLVENDPSQARVLAAIIRHFELCPVGPVPTAAEALALCHDARPDLAIVDVHLAGPVDGISLAGRLRQAGVLPVIFLSATEDEAIYDRMLQAQPLAILPKPYLPGVLRRLINQGLALGGHPSMQAVLPGKQVPHWLFVREGNSLVRLTADEVAAVHMSQQHAVLILATGRRYAVRMTLAELLPHLPVPDFVQCHRQWVVNLRHIEQIEPAADTVRLAAGIEAALGRSYRQSLLSKLRILG